MSFTGSGRMLYDIYDKNGYKVIKFNQDLGLNSDISELVNEVRKGLGLGSRDFAVWFTPGTFLYTRTIAVLVQCFELIRNRKGSMAIIAANEDILYTLRIIGFLNFVKLCGSDEVLGPGETAQQ
jgi:hypothetical protein